MTETNAILITNLESLIHVIRGHRVMLDEDLARLYDVPTKAFNQAVKRNIDLFPPDFMFTLTDDERKALRSQIVTSNESRGGRRYNPNVFTEQGVAMLSGVLKSDQAKRVNIQIMRTFVLMRRMLSETHELALRLDTLESRYDQQFAHVFDAIRQIMDDPVSTKRPIGF